MTFRVWAHHKASKEEKALLLLDRWIDDTMTVRTVEKSIAWNGSESLSVEGLPRSFQIHRRELELMWDADVTHLNNTYYAMNELGRMFYSGTEDMESFLQSKRGSVMATKYDV